MAAAAKNGYYLTRALFAGNFPPPSRFLAKRYNPKGFTGQSGSNRLMFTGISGGGKFVNKFLVANKINGRQKGLILVGLLAAASGLAAVVLFTQPDASRQVNEWLQNMEETVGLRKQNRSAWARSGGGDGGGSGAGGYSPGDDNRQHDGGQLTWTDFLQRVVPTGKVELVIV